MTLPYRDRARKSAPYALAYGLGAATVWILSALFGGPPGGITATTYESEGVSSVAAYRSLPPDYGGADLPTTIVAVQAPSPAELRAAARDGDLHSVRRLLAQEVDPDAPDDRGRTALMLAAAAGEAGVAATLINAGANPALASTDGTTPLMAAAIRGDTETVRLLLRHDAAVFAKNGEGATAHDLAIRNKNDHVARLIADEIDRINRERVLVTRAQFLLAKLGYRPGGIDGDLGPKTRDAIIRFQRDRDIAVDGEVTESLLAALNARQQAVEEARRARRLTAGKRKTASEAAFRRASATAADADESEGEDSGFFGRAGDWLERNLVPDLGAASDTPHD